LFISAEPFDTCNVEYEMEIYLSHLGMTKNLALIGVLRGAKSLRRAA